MSPYDDLQVSCLGWVGTCPMMDIVCLVVDEAHRATGNFSYCMVTREVCNPLQLS